MVVVVVLSGLVGAVGPAVAGSNVAGSNAAASNTAQSDAASDCAATPPDDLADPEGDPLGWEGGYWYNESLTVTQEDGLNDTELNATLARTMARVEAVRCLEFEGSIPVEIISRDQHRERQLNRSVSAELRTFDNAKFEAMFLINESTDSLAVQNANSGSNVLGYYDPKNDSIVVVSESTSTLQLDEITLAHELVHALQDARYNLSADPFAQRVRDDANAVNGLVEGDAQYTSKLYGQRCQGGDWNGTCLSQPSPSGGSLANIGVYFLKFQPYSDGPAFVQAIRERGGWEAVNALYEHPPTSTEQVIHHRERASDSETNLTVEDRSTDGWSPVEPPGRPNYASVGEAGLASMFVYPTYHSRGRTQIVAQSEWVNTTESGEVSNFDPLNYGTPYSDGWDGDRLRVYQNADNETAYVWKLAWDSSQEAEEFVRGYRQVLAYWGAEKVGPNTYRIADGGFADAFHVSVEGSTVTIVNAPSVEDLSAVDQGIEVRTGNAADEDVTGENAVVGDNR